MQDEISSYDTGLHDMILTGWCMIGALKFILEFASCCIWVHARPLLWLCASETIQSQSQQLFWWISIEEDSVHEPWSKQYIFDRIQYAFLVVQSTNYHSSIYFLHCHSETLRQITHLLYSWPSNITNIDIKSVGSRPHRFHLMLMPFSSFYISVECNAAQTIDARNSNPNQQTSLGIWRKYINSNIYRTFFTFLSRAGLISHGVPACGNVTSLHNLPSSSSILIAGLINIPIYMVSQKPKTERMGGLKGIANRSWRLEGRLSFSSCLWHNYRLIRGPLPL